jgi:integration host factor subunit alpha
MTRTRKAVTRVDLYEAVYQKVGLSRTESSAFVEMVLKEITDCLEKGETVKLSSFGSFTVRKKKQRVGRNPKTGVEVPISSRRVMVFKPSAILKRRINRQTSGNDALALAEPRSSVASPDSRLTANQMRFPTGTSRDSSVHRGGLAHAADRTFSVFAERAEFGRSLAHSIGPPATIVPSSARTKGSATK